MRATGIVLTGALLLAAACGAEPQPVEGDQGLPAPMEAPQAPAASMVEADTAFTLDLFTAVAADESGNVVMSPHGVDAVLTMLLAGASGKSVEELTELLRHGAAPADVAEFRNLQGTLRSRAGEGVELDLTASSWVDKGFKITPSYQATIESGFGAVPHVVDYQNDAEAARKAINADVSKATRKHIPELLKDRLSRDTVLVLVSAAYLDAEWADQFEPESTSPRQFTRLNDSVDQVPTMKSTRRIAIAKGDRWRAAELPYEGDKLAMTVIVPDDVRAFERKLSPAVLRDVVASLELRLVDLALPKFEFRTAKSLKKTLTDMGAPSMFEFSADFAGIAPPPPELKVSFVQHEAWVKVDEKGTEAAAATAGGVETVSAPVVEPFDVDQPFLFVVRDKPTGAILFIGRVADPSAD